MIQFYFWQMALWPLIPLTLSLPNIWVLNCPYLNFHHVKCVKRVNLPMLTITMHIEPLSRSASSLISAHNDVCAYFRELHRNTEMFCKREKQQIHKQKRGAPDHLVHQTEWLTNYWLTDSLYLKNPLLKAIHVFQDQEAKSRERVMFCCGIATTSATFDFNKLFEVKKWLHHAFA